MDLNMNQRDLELWEQGKLKAFAVPQGVDDLSVGQTVGKVPVGVMYRTDKKIAWVGDEPSQYDEAPRWSPAFQLPEYAIRRHAVISSVSKEKPIQSITEDELHLMYLDYASQNDPQLLLEEYLPTKNFELLYHWWKEHYKATLKNTDSPLAILLCVQPA